MLKSVSISNFLSFKSEQTFEVNNGVNILVGINGSGKSNFIKALEILYKTIAGNSIKEVVAEFGGYEFMRNFGMTESLPITLKYEFDYEAIIRINKELSNSLHIFKSNPFYELQICKLGETSFYINEKVYVVNPDGNQFTYAQVQNGYGYVSARDNEQNKIKSERIDTDGAKSIFEEKIDKKYYLILNNIKQAVSSISYYGYFDFSSNSKIKKLAPYTNENKLVNDGSNLVQVLNDLSANNLTKFDKFESDMNYINGSYKKIVFQNIAGNNLLSIREDGANKAIPINRLSDGTIKFMLLQSIFLNSEKSAIVCIDEPENNLHPDMIAIVAENIKLASIKSQCFIATHSPLLLNLFEGSDLLIFEKNSQNGTSLTKASFEEAEGLLGNSWLSGKVGATRW